MERADKYSEQALLIQVAEGNEAAFSELFYQWHQEIASYIFLIIKDHTSTDEIVQELFIKLWNKRLDLPLISNFRGYLFTAARNHTYNTLRNLARKQELEKNYILYKQQYGEDPTLNSAPIDFAALMDSAIAQLSPQRQKVYLLSRMQGLSQKQIAAQLGISIETVKKHIMTAVKDMREYLIKTKGLSPSLLLFLLSNQ